MARTYKNVRTAAAVLGESQLKFLLGLARQRTQIYPLDSMDFIMMDLERPDGCRRFADFCTGDLTGRLLEFLSCSGGIDGKSDPRLSGLFERILKRRQPSGSLPKGTETLLLKDRVGEDGFLRLSDKPRPRWCYDDEIPGGPCWIEGAPVNVPVKFANGEIKELRLTPMCSNLSFYALYETPVRFDLG